MKMAELFCMGIGTRHEAEGWSCRCLLLAEVTLAFQTQDAWTVGEKLSWRYQSVNVSLPHQWSLQWIKERKCETRYYSICCKLTWLYEYIHILIACFSLSWGDNLWYWGKKRELKYLISLFCLVLWLVSNEMLIVLFPFWCHPTKK